MSTGVRKSFARLNFAGLLQPQFPDGFVIFTVPHHQRKNTKFTSSTFSVFFCFLCQISTTQKYSGHRTCLRTFQHMKRVTSDYVDTHIVLLYEYRHHVIRLFTITPLSTLAQTNQPPRGVLLCKSKITRYPSMNYSNVNWCNTVNFITLCFNMCFSRRDILFENCVTILRFIRLSRQHVECKLMKQPRIELSICYGSREFLRPLFAYKKVEGH